MIETVVKLKGLLPALVFAALFVAERVWPAAPDRSRDPRARLMRNGGLWLALVLAAPLVALPLSAFAADHALWTRQGLAAAPTMLLVDLVALDLWTWVMHRAYHETPLWRLHAAHHLDEHLDTTSAGRFHLGEIAVSALARMPLIAALAIPFAHILVFEALLLSAALFHHSNLRLPPRLEAALAHVIVTPSIHWVHHHALRHDTDSNYGAVLSLWDPLFGTRSARRRSADMAIGVAGERDRTLSELALLPFSPRIPR